MVRRLINDQSGIAYGIYGVGMMILFGGAFIIFFQPIFNRFITTFNGYISQGMVSQQTADAFSFIVSVIGAMVIFILLGVTAWAFVRALEKKRTEG